MTAMIVNANMMRPLKRSEVKRILRDFDKNYTLPETVAVTFQTRPRKDDRESNPNANNDLISSIDFSGEMDWAVVVSIISAMPEEMSDEVQSMQVARAIIPPVTVSPELP